MQWCLSSWVTWAAFMKDLPEKGLSVAMFVNPPVVGKPAWRVHVWRLCYCNCWKWMKIWMWYWNKETDDGIEMSGNESLIWSTCG